MTLRELIDMLETVPDKDRVVVTRDVTGRFFAGGGYLTGTIHKSDKVDMCCTDDDIELKPGIKYIQIM